MFSQDFLFHNGSCFYEVNMFILCTEALDQLQCESSSLKNEFETDEQQLKDLRGYKQNQLDKAWQVNETMNSYCSSLYDYNLFIS